MENFKHIQSRGKSKMNSVVLTQLQQWSTQSWSCFTYTPPTGLFWIIVSFIILSVSCISANQFCKLVIISQGLIRFRFNFFVKNTSEVCWVLPVASYQEGGTGHMVGPAFCEIQISGIVSLISPSHTFPSAFHLMFWAAIAGLPQSIIQSGLSCTFA